MNFIERIKERAKKEKKTIVLPETMDRRVLEAAVKVMDEDIADVVLIGNIDEFSKGNEDLDFSKAKVIDPNKETELTQELIDTLVELRKAKGMTPEETRKFALAYYGWDDDPDLEIDDNENTWDGFLDMEPDSVPFV